MLNESYDYMTVKELGLNKETKIILHAKLEQEKADLSNDVNLVSILTEKEEEFGCEKICKNVFS